MFNKKDKSKVFAQDRLQKYEKKDIYQIEVKVSMIETTLCNSKYIYRLKIKMLHACQVFNERLLCE